MLIHPVSATFYSSTAIWAQRRTRHLDAQRNLRIVYIPNFRQFSEIVKTFSYMQSNMIHRLLDRVLKEGVQFWYNETSTVKRGGVEKTFLKGGLRKRSSGKPLKFTLLHVSICSKLVRNFQTHMAL
jgi:hypothetical protein